MPIKVRFLLGAMTTAVALIVLGFFINTKNLGNFGANITEILKESEKKLNLEEPQLGISPIPRSDIDKDGLFDKEEPLYRTDPLNKDTDGDGFLDGEEVAAGCSPILVSPRDCNLKPGLSQAEVNLTDYFASLIVGGFLSDDLNKSNPNFQNYIATLTEEASQIQRTVLYIDESNFDTETTDDDSKKTGQEYLNKLEDILRNHFLKKEDGQGIGINDLVDFDYSPYLKDAETTHKELSELKSPPSWTELHKNLLKFFFELKTYFSNLDNQKEDPIKALLTLKQTKQLLKNYDNLVEKISEKIKNGGLETKIFKL